MRFKNEEVLENLQDVINKIKEFVKTKENHPPAPSLPRRG
jgi:very-short-patch-repair endonuclease